MVFTDTLSMLICIEIGVWLLRPNVRQIIYVNINRFMHINAMEGEIDYTVSYSNIIT